MRSAFFKRSAGWRSQIKKKAKELNVEPAEAEKTLRKEREREIDAVLLWISKGARQEDFGAQPLPEDFFKPVGEPLENEYFGKDEHGKFTANVGQIFTDRSARCHDQGKGGAAGQIHLGSWEEVAVWVPPSEEGGSSGMSLMKLAQTTHVHLLGFSMLYGLTGLILAFSSYPGWLRVVLCPLPLLAQVVDIGCWWMGRFDPIFAHLIIYTGGVVALGLFLHIVLSLLNMYGIPGKLVLLLLFAGAAGGGFMLKTKIIDPYLASEKQGISAPAAK
jgi:hypothetical protein